jgi:excisionase family DNA binding protein
MRRYAMLSAMPNDDRLINSREACALLGVDRATLIRWVHRGKIAAAHKSPGSNGAYLFSYATVARLATEETKAKCA